MNDLSSSVTAAREFAIKAHGDQKYGKHPYVYHLDKVAEIVRPWGDELMIIAYLHDIMEDTNVMYHRLASQFGSMVANCVLLMTDVSRADRETKKRLANVDFSNAGWDNYPALIVKAADRLANVTESVSTGNTAKLEMYRAEHAEFWAAAYRPMLCNQIWTALDSLLNHTACETP
ncbi:HD/PDEase domain containing protein [uncultured Caudovirales phage]|uniref:HD/PDEase domain containing protein n=1 Tax=uncultured Caudovirales phage TaxID=2100421 RepID=A0A6J5RDQ3_9CAUD|nr:HD/PDEase domain containing protein [uncultured Caudovirales phage]